MATGEELVGLPPHVISVNELDPVRDEGLEYYRRLVRAGVPAVGQMVAGTCHAGDLMLAAAMPDVFDTSIRDVSGFAKSLGVTIKAPRFDAAIGRDQHDGVLGQLSSGGSPSRICWQIVPS